MKPKTMRSIIRFLMGLFTKIKVYGLENFPATGACIGVGNHLGRLDAFLPFAYLDRDDLTMMAADKYRNVPGLAYALKVLNGVWVDRENADFKTMRELLKRLKAGHMVVIAPEGTRSKTEALIEGKQGTSYLVVKMGVPVIPAGVWGTEDSAVRASFKRLHRPKAIVNVGKAFTLPPLDEKNDRDVQLQQATDEIMCQIGALLPPKYRGVYADHPRLKALLLENGESWKEIAG
ncbi:MAG: lysophospholipid acyltransferase family protein [Chloroflexota bacterium]